MVLNVTTTESVSRIIEIVLFQIYIVRGTSLFPFLCSEICGTVPTHALSIRDYCINAHPNGTFSHKT